MTMLDGMRCEVDDSEKNKIRARVSASGADESFNKILAEVQSVARDPDERLRLLTEQILINLAQRQSTKKTHRQKRLGVISFGQIPKKKRSDLMRLRAQKTLESKNMVESVLIAMSASAEKNKQPVLGPRKVYHINLKFRNVQIARIESVVAVS